MRFSIGIDDFKKLRTDKDPEGGANYYCDKTLFIKDLIYDGASVLLFPRPRRFGKSLNLSMLKYFFGTHEPLFTGLAIEQYTKILEGWRGKFPVVSLGFKDLKADDYESLKASLKLSIQQCYRGFSYLQGSSKLSTFDQKVFSKYLEGDFLDLDIGPSLKELTELLEKHHGAKVWVLIDEYDTPLQSAYLNGFFKPTASLFKNMLGAVLKSNEALYKGVLTGITRISKESLFSDLNNITVYDITCKDYAQYFGFTEGEVEAVCPKEHLAELKSWYNGYRFGNGLTIYNPWSILHFLKSQYELKPYWVNTSSNELIRDSLTADKLKYARDLIEGRSIDIPIEPYTVMDNLSGNAYSFWNLLFVSGYLTLDAQKHMMIPNLEVQHFFEQTLLKWFDGKEDSHFIRSFLADLVQGNGLEIQQKLSQLILETMSFHDVTERKQESFYHGFLLGVTLGLRGRYLVKSNREGGYGRYDLALYPTDPKKDPGILIEVKMGQDAQAGLDQVQEKAYYHELKSHGCQRINTYSFAFDGKVVSSKTACSRLG